MWGPGQNSPATQEEAARLAGASLSGWRQWEADRTSGPSLDVLRRLEAAYPERRAKLGDVAGGNTPESSMVFDTLIEPETGRYLADHQAFCRRWRAIGGEVWLDTHSRLSHIGERVFEATDS